MQDTPFDKISIKEQCPRLRKNKSLQNIQEVNDESEIGSGLEEDNVWFFGVYH